MSQGGWKKHLLRSGVPLEYEVAQVLANRAMSVEADFSFMRRDGLSSKESSVDIQSDWFDDDDPNIILRLLVECKFRSENKTLLFVPDPNQLYSPVTLGGTVHSYDFGVRYNLPLDAFVDFESAIEYVYKGVEISDDGAFEEQIWHGIQQLRYGVPVLLRRAVEDNLFSFPDEALGMFFANILVTNAPIRILRAGCTIADIKSADTLEEISNPTDRVILFSEYGPDYEDHFGNIFKGIGETCAAAVNRRQKLLREAGKTFSILNEPKRLLEDFERADRYQTQRASTQFFVVTLSGLDDLLVSLQQGCAAAFAARSYSTSDETIAKS